MTLFRAGQSIVYFAHIPKTGGTSVSVALRDAGAEQAFHFARRVGGMRCSPQHFHDELLHAVVPAAFYDAALTVVRDPYSRIVSEYRYRMGLEDDVPSFDRWATNAIAEFASDPYVMDNHIRPQTAFVRDDMTVFRFEDGLGPVVEHASALLGLPTPKVAHHKRSPTSEVTASASTVRLIREFYADDFRAFDYPPDEVPLHLTA